MSELLTTLKSIPDVVWSGVIASLLTLSGVLLSNRSNSDRLKLQLQHDASEKAKERTANLRRETYLQTTEELAKVNMYLASLPQVDLTKVNASDGMQGFFTAAARLQLVAEPKTALLVNQLAARYSELVIMVMSELISVTNAKSDINIADDLYNKAQAEVTRLLSEMAKQNESPQPNEDVLHALNKSFEFQHAQSNRYADERSDAWDRFNASSFAFHRSLLRGIRDIGERQISVMVEIRRDLGLTGDLSEIEDFMKQQWEKMDARLDTLIKSLQNG